MVEVLGDAAASQMGAALVKNTGVPSVVISPKNDLSMTVMKQKILQKYLVGDLEERTEADH